MNDRKCLHCHEQLIGRADQKFCNDHCRSTYNNAHNIDTSNVVKTINRILKKNHSILHKLSTKGKSCVNKSVLVNKGYRFEYYTKLVSRSSNNIQYFCYDYGFIEKDGSKLDLMQRDLDKKPD